MNIALLAPTGTKLWIYERELETHDIPIATQAGKGFFRRQEVQDLIAVVRAIADRRDTLALGAVLRGPLVGLTEEELADEIQTLQQVTNKARPLYIWTDPALIRHPVLKGTIERLQNLARKARRTTPYQLLAEALEELQVRPILKARHPRGSERPLANIELLLEMARALCRPRHRGVCSCPLGTLEGGRCSSRRATRRGGRGGVDHHHPLGEGA